MIVVVRTMCVRRIHCVICSFFDCLCNGDTVTLMFSARSCSRCYSVYGILFAFLSFEPLWSVPGLYVDHVPLEMEGSFVVLNIVSLSVAL